MSVRLVYETHATTLDNERGVATGWQPGELSLAGRDNARSLGMRRRDDGLALVVCSDLERAAETVSIAFSDSEAPVRYDPRLREVDYGELTGAPVPVIEAQRRRRVDEPYPGGQSYREVSAAVGALLEELVREYDGAAVLLVGHAATRYALDHLLTGRPLETAVAGPFRWREGWTWTLEAERPVGEVHGPTAAAAISDELVDVYRRAFTAPGYDEPESSVQRFATEQLRRHLERDGFRCSTVRAQGRLVAFGYGYTGSRGQWWSDQVAAHAPPQVVDTWLDGHLEVVELAVDPGVQGQGYGAAAHDLLLLGAPQDRALLTTYRDPERPAPRLYRALGWQLLAPAVLEDGDLYGLDLAAWRGMA